MIAARRVNDILLDDLDLHSRRVERNSPVNIFKNNSFSACTSTRDVACVPIAHVVVWFSLVTGLSTKTNVFGDNLWLTRCGFIIGLQSGRLIRNQNVTIAMITILRWRHHSGGELALSQKNLFVDHRNWSACCTNKLRHLMRVELVVVFSDITSWKQLTRVAGKSNVLFSFY